jgi:imidazolonepropionase-like amidohydrolase
MRKKTAYRATIFYFIDTATMANIVDYKNKLITPEFIDTHQHAV